MNESFSDRSFMVAIDHNDLENISSGIAQPLPVFSSGLQRTFRRDELPINTLNHWEGIFALALVRQVAGDYL